MNIINKKLASQCHDGLNLEFFCPEIGHNVIINASSGGHGTFDAGSALFGHSFEGHRLKMSNFQQYWFKHCHLNYHGVLARNEQEVLGAQKFGDATPYSVLTKNAWFSLSLGVTDPSKEFYPGYLPADVAKYYGFPTDLTGKGQSIAVISLGGKIDLQEVENDFSKLGITPAPKVAVVDVDAISADQDKKRTLETHLDIEVIGSICPEAKITVYRGSNPNGFAPAVERAVKDRNSVISISWGGNESASDNNSAMEAALDKAVAAGITVCVAAGDDGSSNTRDDTGSIVASDGKAHCDYPASSPNVLACGGTQIDYIDGTKTEVVWNNTDRGNGATGGGVSSVFSVPKWQTAHGIAVKSANDGKSTGRVIPDVAALAAVGDWDIYKTGGSKIGIGGTSAVAPIWAALIALANEKRSMAKPKKGSLGFINGQLYQIAAKGGYFKDIVHGNNRTTPNYPGYDAETGFDACTGWGTPMAGKLINALAALPEQKHAAGGAHHHVVIEAEHLAPLMPRVGGGVGAAPNFPAPDMRGGFSNTPDNPSAPSWRVCFPGISIDYDCSNCGKSPIINKGMVNNQNAFDLVFGNTCPQCHHKLKLTDYTAYWAYKCRFRYDGVLVEDELELKGDQSFRDDNLHKTLGQPTNYYSLKITTSGV